jgi:hypothetical protein
MVMESMQSYEHSQRATWMYVIPLALAAVSVWGIFEGSPTPAWFLMGTNLILLIVIIDFSSLTIAVDSDGVHWFFGFGWPSGHLHFDEIKTVEITRTTILEGWGLHYTIWHGWLWNVWGFQAVRLTYAGGRRVTLGTDDPQGLREAIERFRKGAA